MALRLDDHWLWDFWLADDGHRYHLLHLQAPRNLGDPELRHFNVTFGHATSTDLWSWEHHGTVLAPATSPAWDDMAIWTGSIVATPDGWAMLYTGASEAEDGLIQRIGLATSPDLHTWTRHPDNPVLEADSRWYERLDLERWHDEAWRDPWMHADPTDGHVHVFVTARANHGERYDRGVIAHARSRDFLAWEMLPSITAPSGFGQLEVPQLVAIGDHWYMLFSSDLETQSEGRRATGPGTGTYYLVADAPYGPYSMLGDGVLEADRMASTYAGKIHRTTDGVPWFIAWNRVGPDGNFVGDLTTPRRVEVNADGTLRLVEPMLR